MTLDWASKIDGCEHTFDWSAVSCVGAANGKVAPNSKQSILVLMIGMDCEDGDRTLVVGETEPNWVKLVESMTAGLPRVVPFQVWGSAPAQGEAHVGIYGRE